MVLNLFYSIEDCSLSSGAASAGLATPPSSSKNEFCNSETVYLAPCERQISKSNMEYIINDSIPTRSVSLRYI